MSFFKPAIHLLALAAFAAVPATSFAIGKFIPAPQRVDMVYDDFRGLLYITQGNQVLRYDLEKSAFLPPFNLVGGNAKGIDISDEGTTLAVADAGSPCIQTIDLETSQIRKISYGESLGPPSVAFAGDGSILIGTGEQWGAMRRYVPRTNTLSTVFTSMRHRSMLCASADGSVVAYAEGDISDGAWGRYRTSDGNVARRSGYTNGTSWFNFEIGVNFDGTQFAIPTYGGCFIYNSAFTKIGTIGVYAGGQPIGVVYHPAENLVYFPWANTNSIHVYNTVTLQKVAEYDFQNTFNHTGNSSYTEGRVKMSMDGKILFCTVDGGVRYYVISKAPLAHAQQITVAEDSTANITLAGTDDNAPTLAYSIVANPTKGQLSGVAPNLTYTPNANYFGADSFTFKVNDGMQDSLTTTVQINVTPVPDAPVATSMVVATQEDKPLGISLNGSDPDGDFLSYTVTMGPLNGTLTGTGKIRTYTPALNFHGTDTFLYKVSDGTLESEVVTVQVNVSSVADAPVAQSATYNIDEDTTLAVTLLATDADNDPLTYQVTVAPAHGTLSGTAPNLIYTPRANFNGQDTLKFKASDASLHSLQATITINVAAQPDAPVANDLAITVDEDTTAAITLTGNDPDLDPVTFEVTVQPAHGTLTVEGDHCIYTPSLNFAGADSFKYVATDASLVSAEAEVTLTVNPENDAPIVINQQLTGIQGEAINFSIAGHDVEGDALVYQVISYPGYGLLSGEMPELTYTPTKKFTGYQTLEYSVSDGQAVTTGSVEILILPKKHKGLVGFPGWVVAVTNQPVEAVLNGWTNLDAPMQFSILKEPKNGSLSGMLPNLIYTPNPGFAGADQFSYRITCGGVKSKKITMRIAVGSGSAK